MSKFIELKQMKLKLQQRIDNAKSKVDNKSPILHSNNILGKNKLKEDALNYMSLMKRNMRLLGNINTTMRTLGTIDSFRSPILVSNNIIARLRKVQTIEKENLRLGLRLLNVRATLNITPVKRELKRPRFKLASQRRPILPLSSELLSKYDKPIKVPSNINLCRRYFRPLIYFDLEIKDVRPLGRIVIEMYTEAAPQVVLQFLHMCQNNDTQRFQFTRIFPSLWMEGKFKIDDDDDDLMNAGHVEYDMRALNNKLCGGIISFQLNENRSGCLFVAISFKPLAVANGRRIAFARIQKGFRIVHCLQDLGTRNGKMTKTIVVVNCGHLL